jgi:hypothetical protein
MTLLQRKNHDSEKIKGKVMIPERIRRGNDGERMKEESGLRKNQKRCHDSKRICGEVMIQ